MKKCKREDCSNEVIPKVVRGGQNKVFCSQNCRKVLAKRKRRAREREKGYALYYLPEEHYVGITNNVNQRMGTHRHQGRITDGYEVLCYFERMVDAAALEVQFHQRGYNGFNYGSRSKNY